MITKPHSIEKNFQVACDRCKNGFGPWFRKLEAAQKWYADEPIPEDEHDTDCPQCDGTGEIDHECDCEHCDIQFDDCDDCNGSGKRAKGSFAVPDEPISKVFHKTALGRAYCLKCTEAMIAERKAVAV